MSQRGCDQQENGNSDIENPSSPKNDGVDGSGGNLDDQKPFKRLIFKWHAMFVGSCMIAVLMDPLFFYLLVVNEDDKCLAFDRRLRIIAVRLRSVTDLIYMTNITLEFVCPYIDEVASRISGRTELFTDAWLIAKRYLRSYFVIDILAVLPIPQVLVPIIFTKMRSSNFLDIRKILNALVLLQYVPRFLRIYLSWRKLIRSCTKLARSIWIKAAFDFCVYILASHVLGAFWYFFSIERETACWHMACENHIGCTPRSFNCGRRNFGNYTFLDDDCPVQKPNTTLVDFGIFQEALQSGTVSSTNILQKILHCFWWGLRNLSSLGQNLQTSIDFWENCFAVFISIFGLLLFLYFIGNVQTYIQMATEKATKKVEDIRLKMESIKANIELWMDRNQLPPDMKEPIIKCIQHRLEENEDIDMEIPISHLSKDLSTKIKRHLCLPLLRKVPILENKDQNLLGRICESLEPYFYSDGRYIFIEEEPIDMMLFITQGSVSCFKTSNGENGEGHQCIEKGEFYGEELLAWGFNGSPTLKLSERPISTKTVKTLTKVEAFALRAVDLKYLVPTHPRTFAKAIAQQGLARSVQKAFQKALYCKEKKNESSPNMVEQATKKVEDIRLKMESIKANIELWMDRNQLPPDMKEPIIKCIQHRLEENEDIDMEIPISHLSKDLSTKIKRHLCLPLLRKVPILENKDQNLLGRICESLEPYFYSDGSYIFFEEEPIDMMLFITQGSVSCFKTSNGENGEGPQCIEKGEFYGEELLAWGFNGSPTLKLSERPISTKTVKTLTKVEAFALRAVDLKYLVPTHPRTFAKAIAQQGLARSVQKAFQKALYCKEKKNESSPNMVEQNDTSCHARCASRLCARPTRR